MTTVESTLAGIAPRWNKLSAEGGLLTPFQSFAWIEQWLRVRGKEARPFILDLDEGATIAPFCVRTRMGVRTLEMLGAEDSDYEELLTTRTLPDAWRSFAAALGGLRKGIDLIRLQSVRDRDAVTDAFRRSLGGEGRVRVYENCPWIDTSGTWTDFLAQRGRGFRNNVKRWERRLAEAGPLTTERVRPPLSDALIEELAAVERASWKWDQGNASFKADSSRAFLGSVMQDAGVPLEVWLLRSAGRLVAHAIVLTGPKRWYHYLTSYRKDAANAGACLLSKVVEAACADRCPVVDLLRGDHEYKRAWSGQPPVPVYEIVWPLSVRGRIAALGYAGRWAAARNPTLSRLRARVFGVGDRR